MRRAERGAWPGRSDPGAIVRLYVEGLRASLALPLGFLGITYAAANSTKPLPGDAGALHTPDATYFECSGYEAGDAMGILHAIVTGIHISSSTQVRSTGFGVADRMMSQTIRSTAPQFGWGHYDHAPLSQDSIDFLIACGPRICDLDRRDTFNRLSNALRLYTNALDLMVSDIAFVAFVTCLEGLFSTATQELSYRLALSIASYLHSDPAERLKTFDSARDFYTVRSKLVHGDKLADNEEAAAIQLAEHYVPSVEEFTRTCIKKIFTDGIDSFIATTKQLDRFYTLLVTGHPLPDALKAVGFVLPSRA
jgi:hypothetical protein